MLRKLGISSVTALVMLALVNSIYSVSTIPGVNAWIVEQQRAVQEQGEAAPFAARAAVAFSRLPTDLLNVGRVEAQGQPGQVIDRAILRNHVSVAQGTRPSVSGATVTPGSTDYRGRMSAVTASTVVVTFGTPYASAPWCDVTRSDGESSVAKAWTSSTTAVTITNATLGSGVIMNWRCDGVMQ